MMVATFISHDDLSFFYLTNFINLFYRLHDIYIDVLLQDFCDVVGLYDDTTTNHERLYFRKLYPVAEPIGNMGTCSPATLDLPWVTRASECSFVRPEDTTSSASSVKFAIGALISGFAAMLVL